MSYHIAINAKDLEMNDKDKRLKSRDTYAQANAGFFLSEAMRLKVLTLTLTLTLTLGGRA